MELEQQSALSQPEGLCPICGGKEFEEFRGRQRSNCVKCRSKERHRLLAMVLRSNQIPKDIDLPVYHFAPERSISGLLQELFGDKYRPADFMPERYSWSKVQVQQIDLTRPLKYFEPESVCGFCHSHVLEHIPTSIDRVIRDMNAALTPGGFHIFQVPVHRGWYREDMNPDLDPDERARIFHQSDHMRQFGDKDFEERVLELFSDMIPVDVTSIVDKNSLIQAGIPPWALDRHSGHSVYLYKKP
jgi:SAM-dependent methyltransferase